MATWYAQNSSVTIDSVNEWNSAANGSGIWLTWASLGSSDILAANAKTSIDLNGQTFTCLRISTAAEGGTAGGGFICSAAATVNANVLAGTTTCITPSGSSYTLTINGNVNAGTSGSARGINIASAMITVVVGNVTGGSASSADGILDSSTGTITVTGTVTGGTLPNAHGVSNSGSTGTATITVNSGNLVDIAGGGRAVNGALVYNPGPGNYMQVPKTSGTNNFTLGGGGGGYFYPLAGSVG